LTGTNLGNTDFTLYFYRPRFGDDRLSKEDMTMDIEKYMLRSEDEMDFLPIIPLNEGDQEDPNGVEIPANRNSSKPWKKLHPGASISVKK